MNAFYFMFHNTQLSDLITSTPAGVVNIKADAGTLVPTFTLVKSIALLLSKLSVNFIWLNNPVILANPIVTDLKPLLSFMFFGVKLTHSNPALSGMAEMV